MPELGQKLPKYGDSGVEAEILSCGCRGSQAERKLCWLPGSVGGMGGTQHAACPLPGTFRLSAHVLGSACQGVAHSVLPLAAQWGCSSLQGRSGVRWAKLAATLSLPGLLLGLHPWLRQQTPHPSHAGSRWAAASGSRQPACPCPRLVQTRDTPAIFHDFYASDGYDLRALLSACY